MSGPFLLSFLVSFLLSTAAHAQMNAGDKKPEPLPDGRMLVTGKVGPVWLVTRPACALPLGL